MNAEAPVVFQIITDPRWSKVTIDNCTFYTNDRPRESSISNSLVPRDYPFFSQTDQIDPKLLQSIVSAAIALAVVAAILIGIARDKIRRPGDSLTH